MFEYLSGDTRLQLLGNPGELVGPALLRTEMVYTVL